MGTNGAAAADRVRSLLVDVPGADIDEFLM
jgi:hypothetical protein